MGLKEQVKKQVPAVEEFLRNIRENAPPKIDGRVLSTALELIFRCGVWIDEIPRIKKDWLIYNASNVLTEIKITRWATIPNEYNALRSIRLNDGPPINVAGRARTILTEYLNYLQSYPKFVAATNPFLFPKYRNVEAIEKNLQKFSEPIDFRAIFKVGVKKHFQDLLDGGVSKEDSLKDTAKQFRMREAMVQWLLDRGVYIPSLNKPTGMDEVNDNFWKLTKEVEHSRTTDDVDNAKRNFSNFLENDTLSSEKEKSEFQKVFYDQVEKRLEEILENATKREMEDKIAEVENLLAQIRASQFKKIDGQVLSTALELIYECGLQMNEIQDINVDSLIYNESNVLTAIQIKDNLPINVTDRARTILSAYVNYFESLPNYVAASNPFLFPKYRNIKAIERDINKFFGDIGVQEIHKVGVKKHFQDLLDQGVSEKDSLKDTAKQFRMTERSVKQLIDNKIQKAGLPKPKDGAIEIKILHEMIDYIANASSEDKVINYKQMGLEIIYIAKQLSAAEKLFYTKLIYQMSSDILIDIFKSDIEILNEERAMEEIAKKELVDKTLSARERCVKMFKELLS
jgi:hypothetical protein